VTWGSCPGSSSAGDDASASVSDGFHALIEGVGAGVSALASLAAFLSFTLLSLFFLLKDGPVIRRWTEHHMGVPHDIGHAIATRTLQSLRGYFAGVTAVAVFNAAVIGLGAVVLGVPEVAAIVLINFVAAYIPYLGAWSAGAFTVLVALGSQGSGVVFGVIGLILAAPLTSACVRISSDLALARAADGGADAAKRDGSPDAAQPAAAPG
jgi:predicted PurR-regulated permease PerM